MFHNGPIIVLLAFPTLMFCMVWVRAMQKVSEAV